MINESVSAYPVERLPVDMSKTYYRYVSGEEKNLIEQSLKTSKEYKFNDDYTSDNFFLTTDAYDYADVAKSLLALRWKPTHRVSFTITHTEKYTWCRKIIDPISYDTPTIGEEHGGGEEYKYCGQVWVVIKEFKPLYSSSPKSFLYLERLRIMINHPNLYNLNLSSEIYNINRQCVEIQKMLKNGEQYYRSTINEYICENYKEFNPNYFLSTDIFSGTFLYFMREVFALSANKITQSIIPIASRGLKCSEAEYWNNFMRICNSIYNC